MRSRAGLTFVDVLIIIAIILLLAALAIPRFVKAPDFGTEEDDTAAETNAPAKAGTTNTAADTQTR